MKTIYVLFKCWYEGDSNLVDDSYEAAAFDIETLANHANSMGADIVYMPGEEVPDDGQWGDQRQRYRIAQDTIL